MVAVARALEVAKLRLTPFTAGPEGGRAMPISLTNVLKWGGSGATIVFAITAIFDVTGGVSEANTTFYVVLMLAGLAAATIGWLLERRQISAGSESSDS